MYFETEFTGWLTDSLSQDIPDSVIAFSFNLYETAMTEGIKFGIELIGSGEFDESNPDWACDEVWEPETRGINIPIAYSGETWEECLQKLKELVISKLDSPVIGKLKLTQGVGIGFIDGDIEVIWKS